MKMYLNTRIVSLMQKLKTDSYAEAAGVYAIIKDIADDGLFEALGYSAFYQLLGHDYGIAPTQLVTFALSKEPDEKLIERLMEDEPFE